MEIIDTSEFSNFWEKIFKFRTFLMITLLLCEEGTLVRVRLG